MGRESEKDAEIARLKAINAELLATTTELERLRAAKYDDLDGPGHCHEVHGKWDQSGEPCEWCAAWDRMRDAIAKGQP